MAVKIKPAYAFAAYRPGPGFGINPYWVKASARAVRYSAGAARSWNDCKKDGWRVVKVKLIAVGRPK